MYIYTYIHISLYTYMDGVSAGKATPDHRKEGRKRCSLREKERRGGNVRE